MKTLPTGEKVVAEDDVWELIGKDSGFKKFVEYCLTRFTEMDVAAEGFDIPDDIEEAFSDKLYAIRDRSNRTVRLSLNGDGYGGTFY